MLTVPISDDTQNFAAQLVEVLKDVSSGDTTRLKAATATLSTRFYRQIESVPALFRIAAQYPDIGIRQLAAVELTKQVKKRWPEVDPGTQSEIKTQILEVILAEPSKPVRRSLARVVSEIAQIEIPQEKWTELMNFLYTCCQSPNAGHREVGVYVLDTIFEVIADAFMDRILEMMSLLAKTLMDPESLDVRVASLSTLGKIAEYIDLEAQNEIKAFRDLLPSMVGVLQQCVANGDEHEAIRAIEVFDGLLVIECPLVARHMPQLIEVFVGIGSNRDNSATVRVAALSFLMWCTVYQKNKIVKQKLVSPLITSLFPIVAEEEPEDEHDDAPSRMALQVLSYLSTNLPPQKVYPDCMQLVVTYMQNPNHDARKAAMLVFSVLVDGCSEHMRSRLAELLPLLYSGLQDPNDLVRRAACVALSSLAEELDSDIAQHHATLLPLVVGLMSDASPRTQLASCTALDAILEALGDDILPYLPVLMEKFISLLDNGEHRVKAVTLSCIGSAAHSSADAFQPYFAELMPRLLYCMGLQQKEMMDIRGLAADTVSAVAEALGKDVFRPHLTNTMNMAMHGLELDDSRLRECSYVFFAVISRVYEEEFAPYLSAVVPQLLKSCNEPEPEPADWSDNEDENTELSMGAEDDDENRGFNINTAIAEEKESAVEALGQICASTKAAFLPYVEDSVAAFITLLQHDHEGVRKAAVSSIFRFLSTFYQMSEPQQWLPGLPLQIPVHQSVSGLAKLGMDSFIMLLDNEVDRSVVAQTFSEFTDALKEIGPAVLADRLDALVANVQLVLQVEHPSQIDDEVDDSEMSSGAISRGAGAVPEDDEEQAEFDAILINNAADLVGALANALGPSFAPEFAKFMPLISKYYKPQRAVSDRSMAVGVVAECAFGLKQGVTPFTQEVLQLVLRALSDTEDEVRSNAAYACGVLVEYSEVDLSSFYVQILQLLRPLFAKDAMFMDNASGAVCRLIIKNPNAMPLDQVLPVVLDHLPLQRDFEENEPVFRCLLQLVRGNNPTMLNNMPRLLNIFAQVLSPPQFQLKEPTRADILALLNTLKNEHNETFQTMVAGMDPQHAQALAHVLQ
ncbi:hypothetical protein HDU90_001571 [Geranomyces variabilis]|nr:hypothetical protein HDU90_001571 [Geranomyces variabilis]